MKSDLRSSDNKFMVFHSFTKDSNELKSILNTKFEFGAENTLRFEPIKDVQGAWSNNALWVYLDDDPVGEGKAIFGIPSEITYDLFFNPLSWELDDTVDEDKVKIKRLVKKPRAESKEYVSLYETSLILPPRPMENDKTQPDKFDPYGNLSQSLLQYLRSQFSTRSELPAWCQMVDIMQNSLIEDALREGAHFSFGQLSNGDRRFQLAVPETKTEQEIDLITKHRTDFLEAALKAYTNSSARTWQEHLCSALVADIWELFHPAKPIRQRKNLTRQIFDQIFDCNDCQCNTVNPTLFFGEAAINRAGELIPNELLEIIKLQSEIKRATSEDIDNQRELPEKNVKFIQTLKNNLIQGQIPDFIQDYLENQQNKELFAWLADDNPDNPARGLVTLLGWSAIWPYFQQGDQNEPLEYLGLKNTFTAFIKALENYKTGEDIKKILEKFLNDSLLVEKFWIREKANKLYIVLPYQNLPRVQPLLHLLTPLNVSIYPGCILDQSVINQTKETLEDEAIASVEYGLGYLL